MSSRKFSASKEREQATAQHCLYAFGVLDAHLHGQPFPEPLFPDAHTALFVTWNIAPSSGGGVDAQHHHRLRGCIGTLEPRPLRAGLKDYALTAALRDTRFVPISVSELPRLSVKVSLLSCFEQAANWQDWEVGKHGIVIEFTDPQLKCRRSATFLPEVAEEQGWSVHETLAALVSKAGYKGRVDSALLGSITLTRYQSSVTGLSWSRYQEAVQGLVPEPEHVTGNGAEAAPPLVAVAAHGRGS